MYPLDPVPGEDSRQPRDTGKRAVVIVLGITAGALALAAVISAA
jgi:hypothetical protein